MIEESHFETFLYISKNKYQIFVQDKDNLKNIFNEEIEVDDQIELDNLSKFLDDNIYKIEKIVNRFIRNIILIIENEKILSTDISIKKNNYEKNTSQKYFETNLIEVKDIFKESYHDQIIMHMVIINKDKNDNSLIFHDSNINDNYFYLEVKFISILNSFTFIYEELLKKHHIKIKKYMSGSYIKSFLNKEQSEFSIMANQLNNGLNKNEVKLVSKTRENKGFFERFFQLFS
jgi:hypothetical protein